MRWVTPGVLWACIILNLYALRLNIRGIKRNRQLAERLKTLMEDWFRSTGHLD